ncbi:hypothetical protein K0M31_017628 [Melipona bicolor]|uniref:Uncharacterized protein n=1 Tax=Melipona bicolor TaxID=60889 RepID=A0AA40G586_9HYME|nr:hypothetical protein K0M31_017628 [Melipona bicolor]
MTLNSDILRASTITDYKPLKFCTNVPGCYFSTACVNLLELNKFPRSITACLRLDIFSKKRLWQLNYDCVSISTELPTSNGTMSTMNGTKEMTSAKTVQMTMTTAMTTAVETEETTSTDVEVITVPGSQPTTVVDID